MDKTTPTLKRSPDFTRILPATLAVAVLLCGCQNDVRDSSQNTSSFRIDETRIVDLTHAFDSTTVYWPTANSFHQTVVAYGSTPAGYWYASNDFSASEHGGTHLDAPIHFAEDGWTSAEIPVSRFIGPAVVVDVSSACSQNPDYRLRVADLEAWEERNGKIPDGAIVLMRSGWGERWPDRNLYFGSETPSDTESLHFPGYSAEAAEFLTSSRSIDAVALDTPSLDAGQSHDFIAHQIFSGANVLGLENVANLGALPPSGAWIIALPMKIANGTGGPARIIAVLP